MVTVVVASRTVPPLVIPHTNGLGSSCRLHLHDGGRQRGLAVVNMADSTDVDMGFGS